MALEGHGLMETEIVRAVAQAMRTISMGGATAVTFVNEESRDNFFSYFGKPIKTSANLGPAVDGVRLKVETPEAAKVTTPLQEAIALLEGWRLEETDPNWPQRREWEIKAPFYNCELSWSYRGVRHTAKGYGRHGIAETIMNALAKFRDHKHEEPK